MFTGDPTWACAKANTSPLTKTGLIMEKQMFTTEVGILYENQYTFPCVWTNSRRTLPLQLSCLNSPDVILVYDGSNKSAPIIGHLCNTNTFVELVSTGSNLFVEFHSRSHFPGQGFKASYFFDSGPQPPRINDIDVPYMGCPCRMGRWEKWDKSLTTRGNETTFLHDISLCLRNESELEELLEVISPPPLIYTVHHAASCSRMLLSVRHRLDFTVDVLM
ncbi:hypothetical protein X975_14076, partial [Stegodyphus mimosarum]